MRAENTKLRLDGKDERDGIDAGYLLNCFVKRRDDDSSYSLFYRPNKGPYKGILVCYLDGYAIVPKEEYLDLTARLAAIEKAVEPIEEVLKPHYEMTDKMGLRGVTRHKDWFLSVAVTDLRNLIAAVKEGE